MKTFTVTYRGGDGKQEIALIEACDRKGLFDELSKRGISAIKVAESDGKVRIRKRPKPGGNAGIRRIWPLAALVAVVVAGGLFVFLRDPGKAPVQPDLRSQAKGKIPESVPVAVQTTAAETNRAPKTAKDIAAEFNEQAKQFIKKAVTNETQWIVPPLDPDDPDNALRTRVSQELGSLLSIEPGEPMPPFPYSFLLEDDMRAAQARGEEVGEIDNGNKQFLDSIEKFKIAAKSTDDEHRLEHKEKLIAAQGELLKALDDGLSVNDTIRAAYEFRKRAYEMRTELSNVLREIASGEDTDLPSFKNQLEMANAKLKEEGIKTIPIEEILPDYEEESQPSSSDP